MVPEGLTPANWRQHPYAPWAFANPRAFLPTTAVERAAAPRLLPAGPPLDPSLWTNLLQETHVDGLIVLHQGRVLLEHYRPSLTPSDCHLGFSISKAVTGLLAEMRIAEGTLDAAARGAELSPALACTAFADASLRSLLDMRDGVPFDEDYANPEAEIHRYSRHFWGTGHGGVAAALRGLPLRVSSTSGDFSYRTPVSDAVALMLEGQAGAGLARLTNPLWNEVGATSNALWVNDTAGRPIASAGFACTLRDLGRLGVTFADGVQGVGSPVLVQAAQAIASGGDQAAFARSNQPTRPGYSYRSGWWVDHPNGAVNALGVFGQRLHVVSAAGLVIARFGSSPSASNQPTDELHAATFAAIRDAVGAV